MVFISLLQVFFRYALNNSLIWSEELARYLFVWVSFLGSAVALERGLHIEIDIITSALSTAARRWLSFIGKLLILIFLVFLIVYGCNITRLTVDQPSAALRIPMAVVYLSIPFGAIVMSIVIVKRILEDVNALKKGTKGVKE